MKTILATLLTPFFLLSQDIVINHLSDNVNTTNAEINFIKKNDTTAYFTVVSEQEGKLESNIYVTHFIDGNWVKKRYSNYNSDLANIANISFLEDWRVFFSKCNQDMLDCKIVFLECQDKVQVFHDISAISSDQFFNTQAFITKHNSQRVLYFVSDRKGGFGGLDIWLSIIDNYGNFGIPINAGPNINTSFDEITPFYNEHEGMMYFSSNRENGAGGFDVYKSEGELNLWKEPKNIKEINTEKDELYLTYYDKNNGYFSSNRKGAKFQDAEYCCNDIFSFHYPDTSVKTKNLVKVHSYLPLVLYFHNDEPDPRTTNDITKKTYKETYISYFIMKDEYEKKNTNLDDFFEKILQENFNRLNQLLEILLFHLSNGNNIEIAIRGYASPLYNVEYNKKLSQRRISSFVNYLIQFKNGEIKNHIHSKRLIIKELPLGETNASSKVSDDPRDKKRSIYSIDAMLERKIEIVEIILKE